MIWSCRQSLAIFDFRLFRLPICLTATYPCMSPGFTSLSLLIWCRYTAPDAPRAATPTHRSGNSVDHGSPRSTASSAGKTCRSGSCSLLVCRFQHAGHQIAQILSRQEEQKGEIEAIHASVNDLDTRMDAMEGRMGGLEDRMGGLEDRMGDVERGMADLQSTLQMIVACMCAHLINLDHLSPVLDTSAAESLVIYVDMEGSNPGTDCCAYRYCIFSSL